MCSITDLSLSDARLVRSINARSILGEATSSTGDLYMLYKQHKDRETQEMLNRYVDILEDELVAILKAGKDNLLAELKKCTTSNMQVDLFNWNTVVWYETLTELKWRVAQMSPEQRTEHDAKKKAQYALIEEMGWETKFGVKRVPWDLQQPTLAYTKEKVDFIFRHSNLAQRLVLALGTNFSTFIKCSRVHDEGEYGELNRFSVYKKTLVLKYHPYGLNYHQMNHLLNVAKVEKERRDKLERKELEMDERAVGVDLLRLNPDA